MKKTLSLASLALVAALSLTGCNGTPQGDSTGQSSGTSAPGGDTSGTGGNDATPGSSEGGSNGTGGGASGGSTSKPVEYPKDAKGAVTALQDFLNNVDKDMDTTYTGEGTTVGSDEDVFAALKKQLPNAMKQVDDKKISAPVGVRLLSTYGENMKMVKPGIAITVAPEGVELSADGTVTIPSSAIRVSYDNKPRQPDKDGRDKFVLSHDGVGWKITGATIS